jgi:peptidoglycan/LPS O-acetylase OafA/YrhL
MVHEVFFYSIFAVLIVSGKAGRWLGVGVLLGTVIYQSLAYTSYIPRHYVPDFFFNTYNFQFLAGFGAAVFVRRCRLPFPLLLLGLGMLVYVGTGMVEVYAGLENRDLRKLGYGLGATMMLIGLVEGEKAGRLNVPQLWARIGSTSYSIYLVHVLVLIFVAKGAELIRMPTFLNATAAYALFVCIPIALGIAFGFMVEQPLQRLMRRLPIANTGLRISGVAAGRDS